MHETGTTKSQSGTEGTGSATDTTWHPRRDDGRLRNRLQRFLRGLLKSRVLRRVGNFAVFSGEDAVYEAALLLAKIRLLASTLPPET